MLHQRQYNEHRRDCARNGLTNAGSRHDEAKQVLLASRRLFIFL
jgi:hypothetical protein